MDISRDTHLSLLLYLLLVCFGDDVAKQVIMSRLDDDAIEATPISE